MKKIEDRFDEKFDEVRETRKTFKREGVNLKSISKVVLNVLELFQCCDGNDFVESILISKDNIYVFSGDQYTEIRCKKLQQRADKLLKMFLELNDREVSWVKEYLKKYCCVNEVDDVNEFEVTFKK